MNCIHDGKEMDFQSSHSCATLALVSLNGPSEVALPGRLTSMADKVMNIYYFRVATTVETIFSRGIFKPSANPDFYH